MQFQLKDFGQCKHHPLLLLPVVREHQRRLSDSRLYREESVGCKVDEPEPAEIGLQKLPFSCVHAGANYCSGGKQCGNIPYLGSRIRQATEKVASGLQT